MSGAQDGVSTWRRRPHGSRRGAGGTHPWGPQRASKPARCILCVCTMRPVRVRAWRSSEVCCWWHERGLACYKEESGCHVCAVRSTGRVKAEEGGHRTRVLYKTSGWYSLAVDVLHAMTQALGRSHWHWPERSLQYTGRPDCGSTDAYQPAGRGRACCGYPPCSGDGGSHWHTPDC